MISSKIKHVIYPIICSILSCFNNHFIISQLYHQKGINNYRIGIWYIVLLLFTLRFYSLVIKDRVTTILVREGGLWSLIRANHALFYSEYNVERNNCQEITSKLIRLGGNTPSVPQLDPPKLMVGIRLICSLTSSLINVPGLRWLNSFQVHVQVSTAAGDQPKGMIPRYGMGLDWT